MAPILISTTTPAATTQLETPVIIIICVCAYLAFFSIVLIIRQCIIIDHPDQYTECKKTANYYCCECCNEESFWLKAGACFQPLDSVCFCTKSQCCEASKSSRSRGFCAECNACGKAEDTNNCCDCWISFAQACDCGVPSCTGCLDSCCGPRRHCDLADCLTCGSTDSNICCGIECACVNQSPDCDRVNCICFEIQLR